MAKKETAKKEIVKKDELREEKMKALENALTQLNKTYGKGSVMKFSDKVADTNLQVISTGCLDLDVYKRQTSFWARSLRRSRCGIPRIPGSAARRRCPSPRSTWRRSAT